MNQYHLERFIVNPIQTIHDSSDCKDTECKTPRRLEPRISIFFPKEYVLQILFVKLHSLITLQKEKAKTIQYPEASRYFSYLCRVRQLTTYGEKYFAPLSRNLENFTRVRTSMTLITCSAYIVPIYTVKCGVLLICSQVFQNLYSNRQASHTFLFMSPYDQAPKNHPENSGYECVYLIKNDWTFIISTTNKI